MMGRWDKHQVRYKSIFYFCLQKGDKTHKSIAEENLFQRREPEIPLNEHAHSTGHLFQSSIDNQNCSRSGFDYKSSTKVVDYGHGSSQGNILYNISR